jgi:hypothetical protein
MMRYLLGTRAFTTIDSALLGDFTKFNSTKILLMGEDFNGTSELFDQIVTRLLALYDGELVSHGSGKLKMIWEGVMQTPLGEPTGMVMICF